MNAPIPEDELDRLSTLRSYNILDTPREQAFDGVTRLASSMFGVPVAFVSLVDEDRQWFKSCIGIDIEETPRDISFCAHAILQNDVMVVPDATEDSRFKDNPLVVGEPGIRFYAGAPLTFGQHNLGTLCLVDFEPRTLDAEDCRRLSDFAAIVCDQLELRKTAKEFDLEKSNAEAASEVRDQFTASIAGALRGPLNTTLGHARSLQKVAPGQTGDEQKRCVEIIATNCVHMLKFVDDVLNIHDLEGPPQRSSLELATVARAGVDEAIEACALRGNRIDCRVGEINDVTCMANERFVRRALAGLLVGMSSQSSASTRMVVSTSGPEEGYAVITAEQFGGRQADGDFDGNVNVIIARRLIERTGGSIDLSVRDAGATKSFRITLPT